MEKPKVEYVVIHESVWQSILSDLWTFGFLVGSVAINEWLLGGSGFLNGVIAFMLVIGLFSKHAAYTKLRKTPAQAIKHIQDTFFAATTPNARPDE
jgi:hypothetical protein